MPKKNIRSKPDNRKALKTTTEKNGKKKRLYEVILQWKSGTRPFVNQKLGYSTYGGFSLAVNDANCIRNLLIEVGNFNPKDVKIVAVGVQGALDKFNAEHRIGVKLHSDSIKEVVKQAHMLSKKKSKETVKTTKKPVGKISVKARG